MMEKSHEFQIAGEELEYLRQVVSRDESLASLFRFQEGTPARKVTIRLSPAEAEQIRDYLTTQLAAVGFDESYSPNEQGKMLEDLIDRFYTP